MFEHCAFGKSLKLSVRGASHAPAITFALEGFPRGFALDLEKLRLLMQRRAPGRDSLSTQRRESDEVEFLEGLSSSITTGGVIRCKIDNRDQRPTDYGRLNSIPRPGHADFGQWIEYGFIPTGGGSNSGRMTAALTAVGGMCMQLLSRRGIEISSEIVSVAGKNGGFDEEIAAQRDDGDSVGGVILCTAVGLPAGIGGALFAGVESHLAAALFAIPGVKGVEFGNGFSAAGLRGSENNDSFKLAGSKIITEGNNHGGVLGGRTSGMPLVVKVAMKPTPTIFKEQDSVDLDTLKPVKILPRGRHDPCIVRRALPVVEAMTSFVLADLILTAERATPRICLTLTGKTIEECIRQYRSESYFSDMVEIRADLMDGSEREKIPELVQKLPVPAILTMRRKADGGRFDGPESERESFFSSILQQETRVAYVDFEDDFRIPHLEALVRRKGIRIIRSVHCFSGACKDVASLCRRLSGSHGDVAKVAFMPQSIADVAEILKGDIGGLADVEHILCAMGNIGFASRVLALRTGSMLAYASLGELSELGHISPRELVRTYRFRSQTKDFALYGVTGWPLKSTLSPAIHNAEFAAADIDAVMVPMPCQSAREALDFMKTLSMKAMAVTIPHKESIMEFLDEVSPSAKKIGAVNTVVCENGRYVGYNTDCEGFGEAFKKFIGEYKPRKVAVLGNGGAAKAVAAALEALSLDYEIIHRRELGEGFDCIVNATPVDPIPEYVFSGKEFVYDLRYIPEVTELMARAAAAGCKTENGLSMLLSQAKAQQRIWRK